MLQQENEENGEPEIDEEEEDEVDEEDEEEDGEGGCWRHFLKVVWTSQMPLLFATLGVNLTNKTFLLQEMKMRRMMRRMNWAEERNEGPTRMTKTMRWGCVAEPQKVVRGLFSSIFSTLFCFSNHWLLLLPGGDRPEETEDGRR